MKMSGLKPGARDPDHGPLISPEPGPDQEAAGFARKLDNAEEDSLMALSL